MVARIFKPAKSAMQSGRGKGKNWLLTFDRQEARLKDPLMGYTSSTQMTSQIKLCFDKLDDAIQYAERNEIEYVVVQPKSRKISRTAYADNFKFGRMMPWTH